MSKKIFSMLIVVIMTICLSSVSVYAENEDLPDYARFVQHISSTYASFIGNSETEFDFNNDGVITGTDLTLAMQAARTNHCITPATLSKLTEFLTSADTELKVCQTPALDVNSLDATYNEKVSCLKNLNSADFRIVGADLCDSPGEIKIYYLGIDEYILETVIIPYCRTYTEDQDIIVDRDGFKIMYSKKENEFIITDATEPIIPQIGKPLIAYNLRDYQFNSNAVMEDIIFLNSLMENAETVTYTEENNEWYFTTSSVDVIVIALPSEQHSAPGFYIVTENDEFRVVHCAIA